MEQVKANDSVWIEFHTPLGSVRKQASVITELRSTESCSYTRYDAMLDDRVVSISLAMFAANDDLKLQNMASKEMERVYNREDGRYFVKDTTLYCIHFYANDSARLEFHWIDCYGAKRGYYGHDCKIRYVDGKQFYPTASRVYDFNDYKVQDADGEVRVVTAPASLLALNDEQRTAVLNFEAIVTKMRELNIRMYYDMEGETMQFINNEHRHSDHWGSEEPDKVYIDGMGDKIAFYAVSYNSCDWDLAVTLKK